MFNKLLAGILLGVTVGALMPIHSAYAANSCEWDPGSSGPFHLDIDLGTLYVSRDAEIGSKIGERKRYFKSSNSAVRCHNDGTSRLDLDVSAISPVVPGSFPGAPGTVLETNVKGVGVQVEFTRLFDGTDPGSWVSPNGTIVPFTGYIDEKLNVGLLHNSIMAFVTLVKTGPITAGRPQGLHRNLARASMTGVGEAFNVGITGTVIQAECSVTQNPITPIEVKLGDWQQSDFSHTGYTTNPVEFNIALNTCIADPSGKLVTNASVQLDPTDGSSSWPNVEGVLTSSVAGVGIQVTAIDGTPVPLGVEVPQMPVSAGSMDLRFKARYYQTDTTVGAGQAKGALSFTIFYK